MPHLIYNTIYSSKTSTFFLDIEDESNPYLLWQENSLHGVW